MMRLFVGLDLPDDILSGLAETIRRLRPAAPGLRWSPVENLHITTKFIGSWPDERLDELKAALAGIQCKPFEVQISGMGWFPNPHSPRILWAAVRGGDALAGLAEATDLATDSVGVARETKPYAPHLTLARVDQGIDLRSLRGAVAGLSNTDWGRFRADSFCLYRSQTGPAGSVYTKLAGFPFSV